MGYKVIVNRTNIKFSACHFLREPLKCSRLHGHNYYVSVEVCSSLNENFFVVDFIELKKKVKEIIKPLDHYILIPENSDFLKINEIEDSVEVISSNKIYVLSDEIYEKLIYDNLEHISIASLNKDIYPDIRSSLIVPKEV